MASVPGSAEGHARSVSPGVPSLPGASERPAASMPSGVGTSGGVSLNSGGVQKELQEPKVADGCFTITFTHKQMKSHADGEACLKHKNLLVLHHPDQALSSHLNPASVCIMVNGNAVNHTVVDGKSDQVMIGPEAGPNAMITARYCIGKSTCAEKCVVKRDEFMAALGVGEEDPSKTEGWDGSKGASKEDTDAENEVAALNSEVDGDEAAKKIFDGWIPQGHTMACGSKGVSVAQVVSRTRLRQ